MRLLYLVLVGFFLFALPVSATDPPEGGEPVEREGEVNCFDYYHFGSVQVDMNPTLEQSVPGETLEFRGTIKNENDYPVLDGSVYVKIFKKSEKDLDAVFNNAYPLMDQFALPENFILPAQGEVPASFNWTIPANAEGGEYFAAFFFQSAKHYNLLGLSFTDDVTGNTAQFFVSGEEDTDLVAFNKNTVTLNGKTHRFANPPLHFKKDESVTAAIEVTNPKSEAASVALVWQHFNWDGLRDENLQDTRSEIIELAAGETKTLTYEIVPLDTTVSYLVVEMRDGESKSFLNIRLVRDGVEETNVNFPSIMSYPLRAGEENQVFSCIHATNLPVIADNTLTLTLRDLAGNVIHAYQYRGDVTGEMMGFADRFTPAQTYTDFTLTTTLERGGKVFEDTTQTYRCQDIDPSLCPESMAIVDEDFGIDSLLTGKVIVGVTVFLGLLVVLVMSQKKRWGMKSLLWLSILVCGLGMGAQVEAKSVSQSLVVNTSTVFNFGQRDTTLTRNVALTVTYEATAKLSDGTVLGDGHAVAVGQTIQFRRALEGEFTSASWFTTGGEGSSPFVSWKSTLAQLLSSRSEVSILRPTISLAHAGTAGLDCSGTNDAVAFSMNCKVTSAGTIRSQMTFNATKWNILILGYGGGINGNEAVMSGLQNAPAKSISFSLNAVQPNRPPANPILTGPASGDTGDVLAFGAQSADPDGDKVRYLFDWNNDGKGDAWAPTVSTEWLASNAVGTRTKAWSTPGTYTIQARAKDENGSYSGWTSKTVTINAVVVHGTCGVAATAVGGIKFASVPTTGFCGKGTRSAISGSGPWTWNCNGSGGGKNVSCRAERLVPAPVVNLSVNPTSVDLGSSATLTWSVVNPADTCVASSAVSPSFRGARATSGSEAVTPTASGTYTLTCTNTAEGKSGTETVSLSLNNKLKICEDSCSSTLNRTGQTFSMEQGGDKNLKACFNPYSGCTQALGDVTASATWTDSNAPQNAFSFSAKGKLRPLPFNRTENFTVTYGGVTKAATVQVVCVPNTCDIAAAKAVTDIYCPDVTQDTKVASGCDGRTLTCPGTRRCDYNVREVAP